MRLAITGSSGYLGRLMVSALEEESHVSQILGLDVVGAPHGSRKFGHLSMDIRDPQVAQVLNENRIDTLLHLAWIFNPAHNSRMAYDGGIPILVAQAFDGSLMVIEEAPHSGLVSIVHQVQVDGKQPQA